MKNKVVKRLLCAVISVLLVTGDVTAFAAEKQQTMEPEVEQTTAEVKDVERKVVSASITERAVKIPQDTLNVSASSARPTYPVTNIVDGNPDTIWHTAANNPPHDLFIDMGEKKDVSHIEITGRTGKLESDRNGFPGIVDVYASEDGETYGEVIGSVNWTGTSLVSGMIKVIELNQPVNTRYLKLHISDTVVVSGIKPAAMAEINLYYVDSFLNLKSQIDKAKELLASVTAEADRKALQDAIDAAEAFMEEGNAEDIDTEMEKLQGVMDTVSENLIEAYDVTSPDGQITAKFWITTEGKPMYRVIRNGETLVKESELGVVLSDENGGAMNLGLELLDVDTKKVDDSWKPAVQWTRDEIPDVYTQSVFHMGDKNGRKMDIIFRVYDEGIGFRYFFPEKDNALKDFEIVQETSSFAIPKGTRTHALGLWSQAIPSDGPVESLNGNHYTPMVFSYKNGTSATLFESDLYDYARMKLTSNGTGILCSDVRWNNSNVKASAPFESPWRGFLVADSIGGLQEKNYLVQNLADGQKIEDTSWIKTGQLIREARLREDNTKDCIDFAAENGIEYIMYDAGWYGKETDPNMNPMKSITVDIQKATEYGAEKGVGIILYVNHIHLENYDLDEVFSTYEKWGVKGVKFGFVNVGDQKWCKWVADAVATAAKYHLIVKIHDEYIPTGLERAYPNLLNVEGVLGDEGKPDYVDDLKQVFTRMIIGPADHTFCYPVNKYRGPIKTDAYTLASPVLFYSPMACPFWYGSPSDFPDDSVYPERKFWKDMPGEWDESRHIDSSFGEYFTMARRNGDEWFLGSLSAVERELNLTADFLKPGVTYLAECYTNSKGDTLEKNTVSIGKYIVNSETEFSFPMMIGGGVSIRFAPASKEEIETLPEYSEEYAAEREHLAGALKRVGAIELDSCTTRSLRESNITALYEVAKKVYDNMKSDVAATKKVADELEAAISQLEFKFNYLDKLDRSQMKASASSERPGTHEAGFVLDGDLDSIWHVGPTGDFYDFFLDLGEKKDVNVIEITGRRGESSGYRGFPLWFEVYTSEDGENYDTKVGEVDWRGCEVTESMVKRLELPETVNTQYIKLHILEGYINGSPYMPAAIAELNLYSSPFRQLQELVDVANEDLAVMDDGERKADLEKAIDDAIYYIETTQNTKNLEKQIQILKDAIAKAKQEVKDELQNSYDELKDMEQGNYSDSSWKAFQDALANSKDVLDNEDATQKEIKDALEALNKAFDGLTNQDDTEESGNGDGTGTGSDNEKPGDKDDTVKGENNGAVKTGDQSNWMFFGMSAIAAIFAIVSVLAYRRKRTIK